MLYHIKFKYRQTRRPQLVIPGVYSVRIQDLCLSALLGSYRHVFWITAQSVPHTLNILLVFGVISCCGPLSLYLIYTHYTSLNKVRKAKGNIPTRTLNRIDAAATVCNDQAFIRFVSRTSVPRHRWVHMDKSYGIPHSQCLLHSHCRCAR